MSDPLATALRAAGYDDDTIYAVVERAAILEHEARHTRWKAGVNAQLQVLGVVVSKAHDI